VTALGLGLGGSLSTLGLSGTLSFTPTYSGDAEDTLVLVDESVGLRAYVLALADTLTVIAEPGVIRAMVLAIADTFDLAPSEIVHRGALIADGLVVGSALRSGWLANVSTSDELSLADRVLAAVPVMLADTVGLALTQEVQTALQLIDELGLTEALLGSASYGRSVSDTVSFADSLAQFLGMSIEDGFALTSALTVARTTYAALTDDTAVADALEPQFLLYAALSDEIDITSEQALSMLYTGALEDGIEISGAYAAPDGSLTTWAMNTRTGAVTEYSNYEFNSFARVGNRTVGASATGLYELLGDDDDGAAIIPRLRSGYLQFGGTHLSRLKAAYIATRGEGDWVLRIEESTGAAYNYAVSTRNMRSTKVHMGKGQRARYFLFELTGDGTDSDLDTLEFVPLVLQRRV
jgi:hypothetical protein